MAHIDFDDLRNAVVTARRRVRGSASQHVQHMLVAAGLTAATILAVAWMMLDRLF